MLYLKDFNNSQKLAVMGLILSLCKNHDLRENNYWVLLTQIIQSQLIKDSINDPLISFTYFHLMIYTDQVKLGKVFGPT